MDRNYAWIFGAVVLALIGIPVAVWIIVEVIKAFSVGVATGYVIVKSGVTAGGPLLAAATWGATGAVGVAATVAVVRIGGEIVEKAKGNPLPWALPLLALLSAAAIDFTKELVDAPDAIKATYALMGAALTFVAGMMANSDRPTLKIAGSLLALTPLMLFGGLVVQSGGFNAVGVLIAGQPLLLSVAAGLLAMSAVLVIVLAYPRRSKA